MKTLVFFVSIILLHCGFAVATENIKIQFGQGTLFAEIPDYATNVKINEEGFSATIDQSRGLALNVSRIPIRGIIVSPGFGVYAVRAMALERRLKVYSYGNKVIISEPSMEKNNRMVVV